MGITVLPGMYFLEYLELDQRCTHILIVVFRRQASMAVDSLSVKQKRIFFRKITNIQD